MTEIKSIRMLSRRDFLKLGGASLAGAALLRVAGCGGSQTSDFAYSSSMFGGFDTSPL